MCLIAGRCLSGSKKLHVGTWIQNAHKSSHSQAFNFKIKIKINSVSLRIKYAYFSYSHSLFIILFGESISERIKTFNICLFIIFFYIHIWKHIQYCSLIIFFPISLCYPFSSCSESIPILNKKFSPAFIPIYFVLMCVT